MATEKPRFSITMDSDLLSQVEDYQYKNRFKSQSKAIIDLVRAGLGELPEDLDNEKARKSFSYSLQSPMSLERPSMPTSVAMRTREPPLLSYRPSTGLSPSGLSGLSASIQSARFFSVIRLELLREYAVALMLARGVIVMMSPKSSGAWIVWSVSARKAR